MQRVEQVKLCSIRECQRLEDFRRHETQRLLHANYVADSYDDDSGVGGAIASELWHMSPPGVIVCAFLGLRMVFATNAVVGEAIARLLRSRTKLGRARLVVVLASGYLSILFYRGVLVHHVLIGHQIRCSKTEACAQVVRNMRCLPLVGFWLPVAASVSVTSRLVEDVSVWAAERVLRTPSRWVLAAVALRTATNLESRKLLDEYLGRMIESLPPGVARALATCWFCVQGKVRRVTALAAIGASRHLPEQLCDLANRVSCRMIEDRAEEDEGEDEDSWSENADPVDVAMHQLVHVEPSPSLLMAGLDARAEISMGPTISHGSSAQMYSDIGPIFDGPETP